MTGLSELKKRGKRVIIGLLLLINGVTISILLLFQLAVVPVLGTALTSSATNRFTAFIIVFAIVAIIDGAIAAWGVRWFRTRSRCPACSAFLNQLLVPDEGSCRHCGEKWNLKTAM